MHYNTNKETGEKLKASIEMSLTQEERVLSIFIDYENLSASEVWNLYKRHMNKVTKTQFNTPITSIRRAITDLCSKNKLIHL